MVLLTVRQYEGKSYRMFAEWLVVVLTDIGDIIAYRHGLHLCQEVYPYTNQNKV